MTTAKRTVRLAALGDIHCGKHSQGTLQPLFAQMQERADIVALCGDLTDYGLPEEAQILVKELSVLKVPVVAVLGNHDFESDKSEEVARILCDAGVNMLDGSSFEWQGVGFAGVKGFAGGFGPRTLGLWGERTTKIFVREALDEALKLETALARLRTSQRIALLHYSPIKETVEGEPPEIFPFLGTSRLEEPLTLHPVTAVFHGHAHKGRPQGKTAHGTPVYNVSLPLLRATFPNQPPFHLMEITVDAADDSAEQTVPLDASAAAANGDRKTRRVGDTRPTA
jgi:Icc-related predicted phosphoesterase